MTIGQRIIAARRRKNMKQGELATKVGMTGASLSVYENDGLKGSPDPRTLIRISEALESPDILLHHCESCLIRQHIMLRLFPDLNNIKRDPAIILARLRKEMVEAAEAAERLTERFSDANYRQRPDYQENFESEMEQILDVKRGIEILEFELLLSGVHTSQDLERVYARQQKKCVDHGHHDPAKE